MVPLLNEAGRLPSPRVWRWLSWAGAAVLILYGAANTAGGWAVLSGLVQPTGGHDHDAVLGHAALWDPLFLLCGCLLALRLQAAADRRQNRANQMPM